MTDTLRFRAWKVNKQQSSGGYKIDGSVPAVRWFGRYRPQFFKCCIELSTGEIVPHRKSIKDTYPLDRDWSGG